MIEALSMGDNQRLAQLMDEHRRGGEAVNGMALRAGTPHTPR
jgi:hypothetical protein